MRPNLYSCTNGGAFGRAHEGNVIGRYGRSPRPEPTTSLRRGSKVAVLRPPQRLDLAYLWPEFLPPQPGLKPALSDDPRPLNQLFITIANPQGALPLEERIKSIYPRYTAPEAYEGPAGLAQVAFREGTPYQGEDLFYEPERPDHFLVRCTRNAGPTAGTCLLERHIGAAELTARFPRDWLGDWQHLSLGLDRLVEGLRAHGG